MPDDEALRRAINREREEQIVDSMILLEAGKVPPRRADMEAADRLDAEANGDLLGWACQRIAFWRDLYYRQHSRYDNLRRLSWLCFAVAAGEAVALIVIYATWGHS